MSQCRSQVVLAVLLLLSACCQLVLAEGDEPSLQKPFTKAARSEIELLRWHQDLDDAIGEARRLHQPILVRAGAKWCLWCRKLEAEIAKPDVQKKLKNVVLVEIDTDDDPAVARRLSIGPIPALRIIAADGHVLSWRDGFQTATELISWLDSYDQEQEPEVPFDLKEIKELNAETVTKLVGRLNQRDSNVREALIRRLSNEKGLAAVEVVKAFSYGNLATRLTALELLVIWKAPLKDVDPWQPETVTETLLADLEAWAEDQATVVVRVQAEVEPLTLEDLAMARSEISKLLAADMAEAEAIIARLARFGRGLVPEVREFGLRAESDKNRMRLDWLRFRLTATDALVLKWPGGLTRLAATDSRTRHDAVEELSRFAAKGDEPLLLELFSHPDPFVRELSLNVLHKIEGAKANSELSRLLMDPEPNVRAAVLKQLSAAPSQKLVPRIAEYIDQEKDPDLIVHAVRLLRAIKGEEAAERLVKLLAHADWQVRAETVEALGEIVSNAPAHFRKRSKVVADEDATDENATNVARPAKESELDAKTLSCTALMNALEDEDGFVVSRAIHALKKIDYGPAAEPLVKSAERHPELAREIAEVLVAVTPQQQMRQNGVALLKPWLRHSDERLRSAAINALSGMDEFDGEKELLPALSDSSEQVRLAAAAQILAYCVKQRPVVAGTDVIVVGGAGVHVPAEARGITFDFGAADVVRMQIDKLPTNVPARRSAVKIDTAPNSANEQPEVADATAVETADSSAEIGDDKKRSGQNAMDKWLTDFQSGKTQDAWLRAAIEPLTKMFRSQSVPEQLAAGLVLVAVGERDDVIPSLLRIAAADSSYMTAAAKALSWLPWDQRVAYFDQLRQFSRESGDVSNLCDELIVLPDLRASDILWNTLAGPQANAALAESIYTNLRTIHRFPEPFGNSPAAPTGIDAEKIQTLAQNGQIWQQRVALAMLLTVDKTKAAEAAKSVYQSSESSPEIRGDAFCVLLKASPKKDAPRLAIAELKPDSVVLETALAFLTRGEAALNTLAAGSFALNPNPYFIDLGSDEKKDIPLPKALVADNVRPLLASSNEDVAAEAAFLLARLGDARELDRLIDRWRKAGIEHPQWKKLVYKAIAAGNDPRRVPILEEIYRSMNGDAEDVKRLYWSIRAMQGPEVLKLRKQIRDETGMGNLR
jgi:HEAT repeat protein